MIRFDHPKFRWNGDDGGDRGPEDDRTRIDRAPCDVDGSRLDLPDDFDIGEAIAPELIPSRRADGWSAEHQRAFCEAIAIGQTVDNAARAVGLSVSSAYGFRNSAKGAAFAIGWTAAQMLQRQRLADVVASRAFCGQTVTVTRASGETVERHFYDNRLTMAVLTRLDRIAAGLTGARASSRTGAGAHDPVGAAQAHDHAARLASGEWDRYLDLLAEGATPARAGLFLAARTLDHAAPGSPELAAITALARADLYDRTGAGIPAEIDTGDLDIARRAEWSAEQWARAEAAGLLAIAGPAIEEENTNGSPVDIQHSPDSAAEREEAERSIWWCHRTDAWRTDFPPPADFYGEEEGLFGDDGYERELSDEEAEVMHASSRPAPHEVAAAEAERDAWLADVAEETRLRCESGGENGYGDGGADGGGAAEPGVGEPNPCAAPADTDLPPAPDCGIGDAPG